jgi:hypothetical protein
MSTYKPAGEVNDVLNRIFDRIDPHHSSITSIMRDAQRLCGRWIMLELLRKSLQFEQIIQRTGIQEHVLFLLGAGLADRSLASPEVWERLALLLTDAQYDSDAIEEIITIALGQSPEPNIDILNSIRSDIEAIADRPNSRQMQAPARRLRRQRLVHI